MYDFSNITAYIRDNQTRIAYGLLALLIFALGWQAGRVMSPYYAAHPIIFEDRTCSACTNSRGSAADVRALDQSNRDAQQGGGEVASERQGTFVASVNSDLYHHYTCPSASRINMENKVWFASAEEARASGREASDCTQDIRSR